MVKRNTIAGNPWRTPLYMWKDALTAQACSTTLMLSVKIRAKNSTGNAGIAALRNTLKFHLWSMRRTLFLPDAPLTHLCEICVCTLVTLPQHINQYTPFSEQSEEMIHSSGNVEGCELCQLSDRIQCTHCMRYSKRGMIYCACGTCLIPLEQVRRLNKERIEVLTIPFFTIKKGENTEGIVVVVQNGRQKLYHQAKLASRKSKYEEILVHPR